MRGQNFLLILKEKEALWYCAQGEGGWKQWRRDISADIRVLFQFLYLARARARQPDLATVTTVAVAVTVFNLQFAFFLIAQDRPKSTEGKRPRKFAGAGSTQSSLPSKSARTN